MFTGIIETIGKIIKVKKEKGNIHFTIGTPITKELHIDQSICHDGVCLTVVKVFPKINQYVVTAIDETLKKTNLGTWKSGYEINLERSMKMEGHIDGHILQGHVDQTAKCIGIKEMDGSWMLTFEYDPQKGNITVEKGSISVNGVSLTVVDSGKKTFSVAIIPFTYEVTNFHNFKKGTVVNIEFDIIGKYVAKLLELYGIRKK
jgi:riboflavin synthase